ncbi:cell division/cell wall cluster transcriptional repressor MraZ [candidate division WWE3 bacterium]|nr:cell division/cell wall cluster transcriptional repressor MraZ [candidate division WWE3 bacterium]
MFLGEYRSSITSGSRIAIPKPFRIFGDESIILTRGYENCIVMVGRSNFEKLLDGVANIPFISTDKRQTARFLLAGAHEVLPDSQGRVVLPVNLIEHARLRSGEVAFLGVGEWIEIWDLSNWKEYQSQLDQQAPEIANRLASLKARE